MMEMLALVISFLAMEFVAWFSHKYLMHGLFWFLHRDHHQGANGVVHRNDAFFLLFALPSWWLLQTGLMYQIEWRTMAGLGIAAYGLCYFLVHDVFIHRRLPWLERTNFWYFKAIRKAHKVHHKHLDRHDGECFGMLIVPWKYFREARKSK